MCEYMQVPNSQEAYIVIYELPLAFRIKSLNNQIRRLMERTAIEKNNANLTGVQYAILGFLSEKNDQTDVFQRDVEAEFNIRRSTATGILKLLENNGYIQKSSVPGDARLKKIVRTEKAKELDTIIELHVRALEGRLTKGIDAEELSQFYAVLKKISDNAEEKDN